MNSPADRCTLRGFTLVEVVVALAVLSMILLATVAALRTFANTQVSLDRLTSRVDEVRTVSGLVRESLGSAITGREGAGGLTLGGAKSEPAYFDAGAEFAAWKSAILFGEGYGGVYLIRVAREGGDLVLRWREPATLRRREGWQNSPSKILVRDVQDFQVAFRPDFQQPWTQEKKGAGPPAAVRFNIRSRDRYWPELIVQVQR